MHFGRVSPEDSQEGPMTTVEILRQARARIADPEMWCRGRYSMDDRFCAVGATYNAAGEADWRPPLEVLERAARELLGYRRPKVGIPGLTECDMDPVVAVNDTLGHSAVLQMFDRAITLADQEGATP